MIGVPMRVWTITPWALNATSFCTSLKPRSVSSTSSMAAFGTTATSGTSAAISSEATRTTVLVRTCETTLATRSDPTNPPRPPPRSARPRPELLTPSRSRTSLMRGIQLLKTNPLTKKTAPTDHVDRVRDGTPQQ